MMEVSSSLRMVYVTIQKVLRKVSLSRPIRIGAPIFLSSTHDKLIIFKINFLLCTISLFIIKHSGNSSIMGFCKCI